MSIYGSLRAGVSGLYTHAQAMGIISDNIANTNTVGYKRATARFANFVINQANQAFYTPGGATITNVRETAEQGLLTRSQAPSDLAVSGKGFFVVSSGVTRNPTTGDWENTGEIHYTRSGQFRPDRNGNLRNAEGFFLLGWPPDAEQALTALTPTFRETNRVDSLFAVNVSTAIFPPVPTTQIGLAVNLDSGQDILEPPPAAAGTANYPPGTTHYEDTIDIIDRQGRRTVMSVRYIRIAERVWQVHATLEGTRAEDPTTTSFVTGAELRYADRAITTYGNVRANAPQGEGDDPADTFVIGTLTFDAAGNLDEVTGVQGNSQARNPVAGNVLSSNEGVLTIFVDSNGNDTPGAAPDEPDDRIAIDIDFGVIGRPDGHSHFEQTRSTTKSRDNNGRAYSLLQGISFDERGELSALFANGESRIISKIPVATFTNPNGLRARTGNVFTETVASGQVLLREGGAGGAGVVVGASLEQSATDIANEFSEMIIIQRAYGANTRVVSTADQMLEELLRAKR